MPRTARKNIENGIYHIICKSNSDSLLFREESDKERYTVILKKYKKQYGVNIYAICFMDNHVHFIIETCGTELSSIMKSINVSYVQYYNKKYDRTGTLMGERYKSHLIKDEKNLANASLYIHKNAKDLPKWRNKIQEYPHSSLGIYLGLREDSHNLIDPGYVMRFFNNNINQARKVYVARLELDDRIKYEIKYNINQNDKCEYRSERKILYKELEPNIIVEQISKLLHIEKKYLYIKNNPYGKKIRAMVAFFMRKYCGFTQREICEFIGNITQSTVSVLCSKAYDMISEYNLDNILEVFAKNCSTKKCMI